METFELIEEKENILVVMKTSEPPFGTLQRLRLR